MGGDFGLVGQQACNTLGKTLIYNNEKIKLRAV